MFLLISSRLFLSPAASDPKFRSNGVSVSVRQQFIGRQTVQRFVRDGWLHDGLRDAIRHHAQSRAEKVRQKRIQRRNSHRRGNRTEKTIVTPLTR